MNASKPASSLWIKLLVCLLISLGAGAALAAVDGQGLFISGWIGSSVILFFSMLLMLLAWRWAGGGRLLACMVILAFVLRLGSGLALQWALPRFAHNSPIELAGYVFADASARDTQAWVLASSNASLGSAFEQEFISDQYGGLLAFSAGIYRFFSPDAHRSYLIIILAAAAAALGVPFLWTAFRRKWGESTAALAGWIMVLFPESILLGSAQMREPFMISLAAVAFWSVLSWKLSRRKTTLILSFIAAMLGLLLFSSRMALPVLAVCATWFLLEQSGQARSSRQRWVEWLVLALIVVLVLGLTWGWLRSSALWDASQMIANSGRIQEIVAGMPGLFKFPFLIVYGLTQPVLPAAIADPAPLVWRIIGILRAVGWYALLPLLVYAAFTVWKVQPSLERRLWVFLMVVVWGWILVSSARAGGDQWDNPRYRVTFLVWLAALAAWAWSWARSHHDAWLWRWLAVEAIFLVFFTSWYISRYYHVLARFPFWVMVGLISVLSAAVLIGGWIWDRTHARRSLT